MDKSILREIGKIYRALNSFSDFLMKSKGLENGQYQFLIRVKENPGINQQDLSSMLLLDKTTTAKAVNKLVEKGYLKKQTGKTDKRIFNLFLTKKGEEVCVFLEKEEQFATKISLARLDIAQKQSLLEQLLEISDEVTDLYLGMKDNNKEDYIKMIKKEKL